MGRRRAAPCTTGERSSGLTRLLADGFLDDGQTLVGFGVADVEGGDQTQHLLTVATGEQQQAVLDAALPPA